MKLLRVRNGKPPTGDYRRKSFIRDKFINSHAKINGYDRLEKTNLIKSEIRLKT